MKRIILFALLLLACAPRTQAQENLFDHLYWMAYGMYEDNFAGAGLNYLDSMNTFARNAIGIGQNDTSLPNYISGLAYNAFKLDTASHAYFNGTCLATGYLNDDNYKDVIAWSVSGVVSVYLGTAIPDSFTLAFSMNFGWGFFIGQNSLSNALQQSVAVCDWDSSGSQGFIIDDVNDHKIYFYHGGANLDSIPDDSLNSNTEGSVVIGHVRDSTRLYLVTFQDYAPNNYDSLESIIYPIRKGGNFVAEDTLIFNLSNNYANGGFYLMDVWDRGVQDFLIGCQQGVLVYKGGDTISQIPSFEFHEPFDVGNGTFGDNMVNCGNFTGRGYPTILITEPAEEGDGEDGWVFLFNCGASLKDSCTGYASNIHLDLFGVTAICAGDLLHNGRTDIMIGSFTDQILDSNGNVDTDIIGAGSLSCFLGDTLFGPPITGVQTQKHTPLFFDLSQNYPNPFANSSTIEFEVTEPKLFGKEIALNLYAITGKPIATIYHSNADGSSHEITLNGQALPPGSYFYELQCAGWHLRKKMSVVR